MSTTLRANPHLRLTAAILVAMLAALAGSVDGDGVERTRRAEVQTLIGGLRLVSVPDAAPDHAHLAAAIGSVRANSDALRVQGDIASDRAEQRALRRARLDASRPTGASLLRTTALPPPVA